MYCLLLCLIGKFQLGYIATYWQLDSSSKLSGKSLFYKNTCVCPDIQYPLQALLWPPTLHAPQFDYKYVHKQQLLYQLAQISRGGSSSVMTAGSVAKIEQFAAIFCWRVHRFQARRQCVKCGDSEGAHRLRTVNCWPQGETVNAFSRSILRRLRENIQQKQLQLLSILPLRVCTKHIENAGVCFLRTSAHTVA